MELKEIIFDLCDLSAPSGFEDKAFERTSDYLAPYVDELKTDSMGNLIAVKRSGIQAADKLMLDAHMDEIGFIITGIEKSGFLRFDKLGGVDPRIMPAAELKILTVPPIFGIIDTMPPHALSKDEMDKAIDPEKLFIDAGLSEEEAKKLIPLGTAAVFATGCTMLADNILCGKSLDDRACVAIIIKIMERLSKEKLSTDIYCLISTQEELGMRGALTGTYAVNPDCAIAIDVTHAATPDSKKSKTMEMRKGAAIGIGPNMDRNMSEALLNTAKGKNIPHQTEVISGNSGTNGWVIQVSREGVSTAVLSLPIKYMHTPVETMCLDDAEATVELVVEYIRSLEKEVL